MAASSDRIERKLFLKAPVPRVWRALSNAEEFGTWFGVDFTGKTMSVGQFIEGRVTYPGYEHVRFEVLIERMEPERLLAWRWHPAAIDPSVDYSSEPTTQVVFELESVDGGTMLRVIETGIDAIPIPRRLDVFRLNSHGWDTQMVCIADHLAADE